MQIEEECNESQVAANQKKKICCSFDIGIRNLGYAVLETENADDITTPVRVLDIDVIDFLQQEKRTCSVCGKTAKIQVAQRCTEDWKHYCKRHVPATSKTHKQKLWKKPSVKRTTVQELSAIMIHELNKRKFHETASVILIEHQPGRATQRTKMTQFLIYAYFMILGYCNDNSPVQDVRLVSPNYKLNMYTGPEIRWVPKQELVSSLITDTNERRYVLPEPQIRNKKQKAYQKRKLLGEFHARQILTYPDNCIRPVECPPELLQRFKQLQKKDDASDAFLQGLSYFIPKTRKNQRKTKERKTLK